MTHHSDPSTTDLASLSIAESSFQPKSEYLREVLAGKKAEGSRAHSASRMPAGLHQPGRDDWILSADDGSTRGRGRMRPSPIRRASAQENARPGASERGLGHKDMHALVDRLEKENFDLKLRIRLQEDRLAKIGKEVDDARAKLKQAEAVERQKVRLEEESGELLQVNNQLVKELEKRDGAVEEAASMIQDLEDRVASLRQALLASTRVGGGSEGSSRPSTGLQDSDYFSAGSLSPSLHSRGRPYTARINSLAKPSFYSIASTSSYFNPSVQSLSTSVADDDESVASSSRSDRPQTPRPLSRRLASAVQAPNHAFDSASSSPPAPAPAPAPAPENRAVRPLGGIPPRSHSLGTTSLGAGNRPHATEVRIPFHISSHSSQMAAPTTRPLRRSMHGSPGQQGAQQLTTHQLPPGASSKRQKSPHSFSSVANAAEKPTVSRPPAAPPAIATPAPPAAATNDRDDVFAGPPSPTASSDPTESSFQVSRDWGGLPKYAALPRNNDWVGTRDLMFNGDGIDEFFSMRDRHGRGWRT